MPFTITEFHVHQLLSRNSGFLSIYHESVISVRYRCRTDETTLEMKWQGLDIGPEYTGAAVKE